MDIVSLVIGFALGVIIVGIAIEISSKKSNSTPPASKHTKSWSISEISNPRIMAEYLSNVEIPSNAKVIVNKYKDKEMLNGINAKKYSGIKGNFILGDDRALILSGPIKKDEIAFWTVEKEILQDLNKQFNEMWSKAEKIKDEKIKG
jgi:hypothetical protein